ncbi:sensor histidine kinase [Spirillospora sp. NBC_01491]|uniref:sensor histidine kinase n=1 Tax=Spirillospora sp. NBC_01491 TaxID=2976007 RepID=UPI002E33FE6F|nr:ATP-binding protein [Spirillospora sp. NBC_01491]
MSPSSSASPLAKTLATTSLQAAVRAAACVLVLLVLAAPLAMRGGPVWWAAWLVTVALAVSAATAMWELTRRYAADQEAAGRHLGQVRQELAAVTQRAEEHHHTWQGHDAGQRQQLELTVSVLKHLAEVQMPAALEGRAIPALPAQAEHALGPDLIKACGDAVQRATAARREWAGREESQAQVLVTTARRLQAAMHQVQSAAERLAEDHRGQPEVSVAAQNLDHLAAQGARMAQRVPVLCGSWEGQQWPQPVRLAAVVQAAAGRIGDYRRVSLEGDPDIAVSASALEGVVHAVAELLANAAGMSPSQTPVEVRVVAAANGASIRIDDHGAGLEEPRRSRARAMVAGESVPDLAELGEVPQLGLPVVGRFAARLGLQITLEDSPYGGLRAVVWMPDRMLVAAPQDGPTHTTGSHPAGSASTPQNTSLSVPAAGPAPAARPAGGAGDTGGLPQRVSRRGAAAHPASGAGARPALPGVQASDETPQEAGAKLAALMGQIPGVPPAGPGARPRSDTPPSGDPSGDPLDRSSEFGEA